MGYMHINNLYADPRILAFKEVFALEKIHGTSSHVSFVDNKVSFFSGGEKHENFIKLFDEHELQRRFEDLGHSDVTVFGEAYGGKCQGMSKVYGKDLRFVAFEVRIGESWLDVPKAHDVVLALGLRFVDYELVNTDIASLDAARDCPSIEAVRNGMGAQKREGVVLRPPFEIRVNNTERLLAKYKQAEFCETRSQREVDPNRRQVLTDAEAVALEWVTDMRLVHVLDTLRGSLQQDIDIRDTGMVVKAMIEDVRRESGVASEVEWSKDVQRAVGNAAAHMFKKTIMTVTVKDER